MRCTRKRIPASLSRERSQLKLFSRSMTRGRSPKSSFTWKKVYDLMPRAQTGVLIGSWADAKIKTEPRWRNWQTRCLEGAVGLKARAGSTPALGIIFMAVRIVVDVMGGDRPPPEIVNGALSAARKLPLKLVLAGKRREIEPHLDPEVDVEVLDAGDVVRMDDPPIKALRKKDSSLVKGIEFLAQGKADVFLSPGNTGALVAAAVFILGRLPGISRPGICAVLPSVQGKEVFFIDVGANVDCSPEHLLGFARMGSVYASQVLGEERVAVGLLNVGTEALKGDKVTREAFRLLGRELPGFVGNVEPHDALVARPADVVVSCGFAGNLCLKALEGGAEAVWKGMREALQGSFRGRLGGIILQGPLLKLAGRLRYEHYNGAPLLGVKGLVFVAHGRSTAPAIAAAVERAFWAAKAGLVDALAGALSG